MIDSAALANRLLNNAKAFGGIMNGPRAMIETCG
jgi:hypothetical protein